MKKQNGLDAKKETTLSARRISKRRLEQLSASEDESAPEYVQAKSQKTSGKEEEAAAARRESLLDALKEEEEEAAAARRESLLVSLKEEEEEAAAARRESLLVSLKEEEEEEEEAAAARRESLVALKDEEEEEEEAAETCREMEMRIKHLEGENQQLRQLIVTELPGVLDTLKSTTAQLIALKNDGDRSSCGGVSCASASILSEEWSSSPYHASYSRPKQLLLWKSFLGLQKV
ncbi:vicilin-like seed storage protein At2g18540 isoform X2 [Rana temporaria]|uniref:vicilin-like seed storage protein At2g18540 isoform X2 n=1 Tax=Rana temporaria TaxID=8407 RepID=UPI001AAD8076|nr:vicilin-like seed storage protein At2g18540 isoform X2 [Rana temporaria]